MISTDLANERPGLPAERLALTQDSAFFGPAPIVPGESADTYADILARVFDALKPADILETFQARDIVDHEWEILRCRRAKANLINIAKLRALTQILVPLLHCRDPFETEALTGSGSTLALRWSKKEPSAVEEVAQLLDEHDIKEDAITAQAIAEVLREIERIDHMIMTLEARRDRAWRELEHHRAIRAAHAPRTAPDRIEDAEYHEVEHQPVEEQHAA